MHFEGMRVLVIKPAYAAVENVRQFADCDDIWLRPRAELAELGSFDNVNYARLASACPHVGNLILRVDKCDPCAMQEIITPGYAWGNIRVGGIADSLAFPRPEWRQAATFEYVIVRFKQDVDIVIVVAESRGDHRIEASSRRLNHRLRSHARQQIKKAIIDPLAP